MNFLILLLCLFSVCLLVNCDSLRSLFVVSRHGERAPDERFMSPDDPYKDKKYWPNGLGQLTEKGIEQMFNIGLFLKNKYSNFLTDDFREVLALSSSRDRCIESGQIIVNGTYDLENKKIRNVPVKTTNFYKSNSMLNPFNDCPESERERNEIYNKKEIKEIINKNEDLRKFLAEKTKMVLKDFRPITTLYDTFAIEKSYNLTLPDWLKPDILNRMKELNKLDYTWVSSTRNLQRLRTGLFLTDLKTKMEKIIKKTKLIKSDELGRLNIYVTHDYFIAALLLGLKIYNDQIPTYGATVIFELHQEDELNPDLNKTNIKIFYLNKTEIDKTYEPHLLKIPECADLEICTVEKFFNSISDLTINTDQWIKECKLNREDFAQMTTGAVITIVVLSIFVLFESVFIIFIVRTWWYKRQDSLNLFQN